MIIASLRLSDNKKQLALAKLGLLFKIPEAYWKLPQESPESLSGESPPYPYMDAHSWIEKQLATKGCVLEINGNGDP
jgi:hypothetical protein